MTRTLLVDAQFLLKRSFNGAKDIYSPSFGHLGGLYQFMTTLRKLVKENMINKVVVIWDGENGGWLRHVIDNEYKANRNNKEWNTQIEMSDFEIKKEKEKRESILKQKKRIQAYLEEIFVRQIEVNKIEADDIIAQYCLDYHDKEEILLYTNDRDFAQLLDLNITILFANIQQPITKSNYIMHFNHHYSNALTIKIIAGDTADNIKGVGGLKETTLLELFPELKYKHLTVREICKKADELNKERISKKLKSLKSLDNLLNNINRLITNFKLTNLREPILNEEAIVEIDNLKAPLSTEGRGSKYLYEMMRDDGFLTIYGSTFPNYVEPFYTVIMREIELYKKYCKK